MFALISRLELLVSFETAFCVGLSFTLTVMLSLLHAFFFPCMHLASSHPVAIDAFHSLRHILRVCSAHVQTSCSMPPLAANRRKRRPYRGGRGAWPVRRPAPQLFVFPARPAVGIAGSWRGQGRRRHPHPKGKFKLVMRANHPFLGTYMCLTLFVLP